MKVFVGYGQSCNYILYVLPQSIDRHLWHLGQRSWRYLFYGRCPITLYKKLKKRCMFLMTNDPVVCFTKLNILWLTARLGITDAEAELTEEQLGKTTQFVRVSVTEVCTTVFHIHPASKRHCPFFPLQHFSSLVASNFCNKNSLSSIVQKRVIFILKLQCFYIDFCNC